MYFGDPLALGSRARAPVLWAGSQPHLANADLRTPSQGQRSAGLLRGTDAAAVLPDLLRRASRRHHFHQRLERELRSGRRQDLGSRRASHRRNQRLPHRHGRLRRGVHPRSSATAQRSHVGRPRGPRAVRRRRSSHPRRAVHAGRTQSSARLGSLHPGLCARGGDPVRRQAPVHVPPRPLARRRPARRVARRVRRTGT